MKHRLYIWLSALALTGIAALYSAHHTSQSNASVMMIQVYAGEDRSICPGNSLDLYNLGAYITGEVTNGYWFTSGDGKFLPGNTQNIRFSTGLTYVPGVQDNANGNFTLTLVSDDPDLDPITGTNGPKVQVSDQVNIQFLPPPVLVCNSNLQVSLNFDCTVQLDASALVANPRPPYEDYTVEMYDKNNVKIPDNILTKTHIKQNITFRVGHACTSTYCWGNLQVSDYYPPVFVCRNDTISCLNMADPMSLGLPIPLSAAVDSIKNGKYYIRNWDACGQVQMTYSDDVDKKDCTFPVYDKIITRIWSAKDESQNLATCQQKIYLRKETLAEITFPPSFDDIQHPSFECLDTFPTFANGHPSTDTTGIPTGAGCENIGNVMTDIRFETCGNGFKIVRSWFVIEWCSQESVTRNQIILVKDKRAPLFECPGDITLGTGYYTCATASELLPLPDSVIDCSEFQWLVQVKDSTGKSFNSNLFYSNQEYRVENLPLGRYIVEYTVMDECYNSSVCRFNLTVKDIAPPIPVCDKTTKVSVDNTGKARLFATSLDDGSWDNCGIFKYEIKRKTDSCGHTPAWAPFAEFCCKDVGTLQHVSLQVTDIHGLINTCHVEVEVDDKIKPTITCPSHLTISCDYAYDPQNLNEFGTVALSENARKNILVNGNIAGRDGLATDNCSVTIIKSQLIDVECFKGNIYRTFIAEDKGGRRDSCTQTIHLVNVDPFDENDIIWPTHYTGEGCKISDVDTSVSGAPRYIKKTCGSIAAWYEDQPFFIADSACVKIFRNWYVIDWCQFNESTLFGRWGPYTQIIKISNHEAPTLIAGCRDTLICQLADQCGPVNVNLYAAGEDDCTPINQLNYTYQVDVNRDGSYDLQGSSAHFAGSLAIGKHAIKWILRDQCGNTTECKSNIDIKDCKKPTPYCISQVSMNLDEVTHQAEIWATDLDLGSFDNCTQTNKLIFSFSLDTTDKVRFLDCSDIPNGVEATVPLEMYVTDLAGNQHFCSVSVFLTDHNDVCQDQFIQGDISGRITLTTGFEMENVPIKFRRIDKTEFATIHTDGIGNFSISNVTNEYSFVLSPKMNTEIDKGLSTLDIVMIQRHIIGIKLFDNPFLFIAADINRSKNINSLDLVDLRKVILGTKTEFPNQTPSWTFIDQKESFPFGPFGQRYADTIVTKAPSSGNHFYAVKIGDVNQSYEYSLQQPDTENRGKNLYFEAKVTEDAFGTTLAISPEERINFDGFEWEIEVAKSIAKSDIFIEKTWNHADFYLDYSIRESATGKSVIKVIGYTNSALEIDPEVDLFSIRFNQSIDIKNEVTWLRGEWYENEKPKALNHRWKTNETNSVDNVSVKLLANPVTQHISFTYENLPYGNVHVSVFDQQGKLICRMQQSLFDTKNGTFQFELPNHMKAGIYTYHFVCEQITHSGKLIKIE